jgi:predicted nuclease of predicted toxin-antitoxin system
MKLLIDECLSPELVHMARERGHGESSHVVWIGHQGIKDWNLLKVALDGDWILETKNAYDFRGPKTAPGSGGQYRRTELHAGLICLNGPEG